MKLYYVPQYKAAGDKDKYLINDILKGSLENMQRWANSRVLDLAYGSIHECEEDAETEIAILRLNFLKEIRVTSLSEYKKEIKSLKQWLNFYRTRSPHLFI